MNDHYFEERPTSRSRPGDVVLALPDRRFDLVTDHGVFARDAVDVGTRFLLLDAPRPDAAPTTALDLGCGYGPIACTLAHRYPDAHVWAVDVNERARGLCAANADRHELHNITVAAPDEITVTQRFDLIWSNPPIRIGKRALHDLLVTWLDRLTPRGEAVIVVQKHLGSDSLQRWLGDQGWPTERVGSRHGYRLLRIRPRAAPA